MASRLSALVRKYLADDGTYYEPFLGGGAVYFHLCPERACLSDINAELINAYEVVRDRPRELVRQLRLLPVNRTTYYRVRALKPYGRIERAARFVYLNRTAWGGIYRLNKAGEFNVPFGGRSTALLWTQGIIEQASNSLRGARLSQADFATAMIKAGEGDVVYCDPTYTVAHDNNGFVRYNEVNFSWADQVRLVNGALMARRRGATVIVSNAHHKTVRDLYPTAHKIVVHRESRVSGKVTGRRTVSEYLLVLAPH